METQDEAKNGYMNTLTQGERSNFLNIYRMLIVRNEI